VQALFFKMLKPLILAQVTLASFTKLN